MEGGNQVEKWEFGYGNKDSDNFIHPCMQIVHILTFRMAQIYGGISGEHPMGKFMWGNTKSLSPGFSDAEMHKRYSVFDVIVNYIMCGFS